jgi:hypothetical protein
MEAIYDTARVVDAVLDNPLRQAPEITWSGEPFTRALTRDVEGTPFVNSSKDWFDPALEMEDTRPAVTIVRNELTFNRSRALEYQDAVNSDIYSGAAPRCAKIKRIVGQRHVDLGLVYWRVTYDILFRRDSFDLFVLDQGFRDVDGKLFRDPIDFTPLANPSLLNGRGKKLSTGSTTLAADIDDQTMVMTVADGSTNFPLETTTAPHWYFEVKVDNEIMQVRVGAQTNTWVVVRGHGGTTPAAHTAGATVRLQPYYLRFKPCKILPFSLLALPAV